MCGIFCMINTSGCTTRKIDDVTKDVSRLLYHRGPDNLGVYKDDGIFMLHTRLRINGDTSSQPITNDTETIFLIINGEIFNWKELSRELDYTCTKSDCEVIIPLYERFKKENKLDEMMRKLEGQFSFVLYDTENKHVLIGRDRIGVTPLYIGHGNDKTFIASEMKCLDQCETIDIFYPRTYVYDDINKLSQNLSKAQSYIDFDEMYRSKSTVGKLDKLDKCTVDTVHENIRSLLKKSVQSQLEDLLSSGSPDFGVLLSGGLDSSLIASLVVEICKKLGYPVKTFSIGVHKDVPDLVAARQVAAFLGTDHHEFYFDTQLGLQSIDEVVWHIESYDCTSVRASTAMFLLSKQIKQKFNKLKVVFSGELSDELLCYLYGANAPSQEAFQDETVNLVSNVHRFDCLRANKTCMAHSMEARVPFTDSNFVDYILKLHPKWKCFGKNGRVGVMEKQILRDAFVGYLPNEILYRKKEQFSDGVSGFNGERDNLIDAIKNHCEKIYSDDVFENERKRYDYNPPLSKEMLHYRKIFSKLFGHIKTSEMTVKSWEPKWSDCKDPSGRVQTFWKKN